MRTDYLEANMLGLLVFRSIVSRTQEKDLE